VIRNDVYEWKVANKTKLFPPDVINIHYAVCGSLYQFHRRGKPDGDS
jgi:hypothetical protein